MRELFDLLLNKEVDFLTALDNCLDENLNVLIASAEDAEYMLYQTFIRVYANALLIQLCNYSAVFLDENPLFITEDVEKDPKIMNKKHMQIMKRIFEKVEQSCKARKFAPSDLIERQGFKNFYQSAVNHRFTKLLQMFASFGLAPKQETSISSIFTFFYKLLGKREEAKSKISSNGESNQVPTNTL